MIIKPFSRQLKAMAETVVKAPSKMGMSPTVLLAPNNISSTSRRVNAKDIIGSIQEFVAQIPHAVKQRKDDDIEPGAFNDPVAKLFRKTTLSPHDWHRYAWFDESLPYTRNLIATDRKTYTLLLLCWNAGQESPIHDHPCDGCWLKVLQGDIREVRYDTQLNCVSDETFGQGALSYITDHDGYHKVGNPSNRPSVSLHLYAPPFQRCLSWRTQDIEQACVSECSNFSEYGFKVR
ncbi:metal-dependent protein [Nitzschia inconspicua]|uniref:Cysteine dioxygenase n=1 Tax=Nitzschia inconspicua TaxID=303405 RepID=A0A9K3PHB1_9STRA|nr:metal-dependent protein [Nitzschia inconspicua]